MTAAAVTGLALGALHAVSGPDHVLSLIPLTVSRARRAWRVGAIWGAGHAVGTVAAAGLLVLAASWLPLSVIDGAGERLAGLALLVAGLVGLRRARALRCAGAHADHAHGEGAWGVAAVGLVHGVTGAAAVLLLFPAALRAGAPSGAYLAGFAFGSTVAMAALTQAFAAATRNVGRARWLSALPGVASAASVLLGAAWLLA